MITNTNTGGAVAIEFDHFSIGENVVTHDPELNSALGITWDVQYCDHEGVEDDEHHMDEDDNLEAKGFVDFLKKTHGH